MSKCRSAKSQRTANNLFAVCLNSWDQLLVAFPQSVSGDELPCKTRGALPTRLS